MRKLRTRNPKEFWKIFDRERKRETTHISVETLFDFFKDLNKNKFDKNDDFLIINNVISELSNEILNGKITAEEIITAVKELKNNKSPGMDNIVNEYISGSLDYMIDIYVELFNLIFDSGILPEIWFIVSIISVYKKQVIS